MAKRENQIFDQPERPVASSAGVAYSKLEQSEKPRPYPDFFDHHARTRDIVAEALTIVAADAADYLPASAKLEDYPRTVAALRRQIFTLRLTAASVMKPFAAQLREYKGQIWAKGVYANEGERERALEVTLEGWPEYGVADRERAAIESAITYLEIELALQLDQWAECKLNFVRETARILARASSIPSDVLMFDDDQCAHPSVTGGVCAVCGQNVKSSEPWADSRPSIYREGGQS